MLIALLFSVAVVLSRANAHDTGDNPHMESEFDDDEGTFTYILKVPVADKKDSMCQCEVELKQLQDQLDALELRFEKVLGKLNSVTLQESLDRDAEKQDGEKSGFTDDLSSSERVTVNTDDSEGVGLSENGTRVEGPENIMENNGLDSGNVIYQMNETETEQERQGSLRNRGDAPGGLYINKEQNKAADSFTDNDIKINGHTDGSDEDLDEKDAGLTVELPPSIIRSATTLDESTIKVEDGKQLVEIIDKQDIDDPCTGGCACFKDTTESGVYAIKKPEKINKKSRHMKVYCDMSTDHGGWTVIQRRFDGSENFYRSWAHYARGFGSKNSEFWIGNNIIHAITTSEKYELRIEFEDWEGQQGFAHYDSFYILDEKNMFRLYIGKFVGGNRGDSMSYHNNTMFTTKDRDNDWFYGNCAQLRQSGFWFKECNHANPNGLWLGKGDGSGKNGAIITWGSWGTYGYKYCMKSFKMMIRPVKYAVVR